MADDHRPLQSQRLDERGQVVSMRQDAIASRWPITVAAPAQIIGKYPVIGGQMIGQRLKTERIGRNAMYANDRRALFTPLDLMESDRSGSGTCIARWLNAHPFPPGCAFILRWLLSGQKSEELAPE